MQIPEALSICGIRYRIEVVRETMPSDAAGATYPFRALIKLDEAAPPERLRWVLIHEILEAIDHELELALPHRSITSLGTAINQALKDNPALCALYGGDQNAAD